MRVFRSFLFVTLDVKTTGNSETCLAKVSMHETWHGLTEAYPDNKAGVDWFHKMDTCIVDLNNLANN